MEPARSTDEFTRRITSTDANNIITILDLNQINSEYQIFQQDYVVTFQTALEDLKVTVFLPSLAQAPWPQTNALMSESETMAEIARIRTEGQKISLQLYTAKGNGPWVYQSKVVLQNQGNEETHVPVLVPFLSTNETLLVGGNFKLGARVEPIWNQPLKINDYLIIKGTYKQVVSFSKKKDDDLERLSARIETLELALEGKLINLPANTLLGKNLNTGIVESIPQSQFVNTQANQTVGGAKTFTAITTSNIGFSVVNPNGRVIVDHNGATAARFQAWGNSTTTYGQYVFNQYFSDGSAGRNAMVCNPDSSWNIGNPLNTDSQLNTIFGSTRITGFTTLGDNIGIKVKRITGTLPASQGGTLSIPLNINSAKVNGFIAIARFDDNGQISPDFTLVSGFEYEFHIDENTGIFRLSTSNSSMIVGKPCEALVFYTA